MKRFVAITAVLLACHLLFSQAKIRGELTGKVTDINTGEVLPGASVMIAESRLGTITNKEGTFTFKNIPLGHAIIEVSHAGYETIVDHIDISPANLLNFQLKRSVREYEGVTVTGVAGATSIRKAPIPVTRVNKNELLSTPSTNIIDALTRQPGVSQLTTGPGISKPVIRGLGYNRLVTINDGVRQEGQQWGDEHGIEIDENSVSRIEILKGPASLIYGSDAIAGVINVITTLPVPNNTHSGNFLTSYQTNNRQRSAFLNFAANHNGFNYNVWLDRTVADDYKNKYDGKVFNSRFNSRNAGGYVGYNGGWGFSHLIFSYFNQEVGVVEGERNADGSFTDASPTQQVDHIKLISDNIFTAGSGKVKLNVGWQQNKRREFESASDMRQPDLYFDLGTFNYHASYQFDDRNDFITSVGVNGMFQQNNNRGAETLIPEYNLFDAGVFLYSQKTIEKATISGGLRFDNRRLNSKQLLEDQEIKFAAFTNNYSNFSGSLGVSYTPISNLTLKLNVARGFRAPAIPELASNGTHEGTNRYEFGDQNLRSETTLQGDFDVEISTEHVLMSLSTFYNRINDFIFYSRLSNAAGNDSLVEVEGELIPAFKFSQHTANLPGFEVLVDIHPHPLDWLHWENSLSYVRGRFTEAVGESRNVPSVPATRWSSEIITSLFPAAKMFQRTSFTVEAVNYFRQNAPFTSYGTETITPGYFLLNAGFSTSIHSKKRKMFSLYFTANNLTDKAYQQHLSRLKYASVNEATGRSGVYNMGRNFMIKVNVNF